MLLWFLLRVSMAFLVWPHWSKHLVLTAPECVFVEASMWANLCLSSAAGLSCWGDSFSKISTTIFCLQRHANVVTLHWSASHFRHRVSQLKAFLSVSVAGNEVRCLVGRLCSGWTLYTPWLHFSWSAQQCRKEEMVGWFGVIVSYIYTCTESFLNSFVKSRRKSDAMFISQLGLFYVVKFYEPAINHEKFQTIDIMECLNSCVRTQ